jgi:DnaJ like chaperone protein
MAKFGKWIAGGLGWGFFGPIGGLVGFALGSILDHAEIRTSGMEGPTTRGDFAVSLLVLVAAVMKADDKVLRSELNYVKTYFVRSFGEESAAEAIQMLRNILQQQIPLEQVCIQIRDHLDYSSRLQLLHFLFGISASDNEVHPREVEIIARIATLLNISGPDHDSVKAMFVKDTNWAYKVLEIEPTATEEDIKKAYRKMAMLHHPDKVAYLGDDLKKAANEKFRNINLAYETICKEKGIK